MDVKTIKRSENNNLLGMKSPTLPKLFDRNALYIGSDARDHVNSDYYFFDYIILLFYAFQPTGIIFTPVVRNECLNLKAGFRGFNTNTTDHIKGPIKQQEQQWQSG